MIVAMNRFYLHDPWAERLRRRFLGLEPSDHAHAPPAGLLRSCMLVPRCGDLPHVSVALWEDMAALRRWVQSDAFKRSHSPQSPNRLPPEAFSRRRELELYTTSAPLPELNAGVVSLCRVRPQGAQPPRSASERGLPLTPMGAGQPWVLLDVWRDLSWALAAAEHYEGAVGETGEVRLEVYPQVLVKPAAPYASASEA
ncbi:antibiotic biosynthesis monooxygenase family protein [Truepera radiovictrix]|uniref:Antibiotic biosynthesis monooxygenase n=1 Tax=Truepera radiovictrix (strain DSM 17093 / CIP 108686 / LMG 22925 / RQ-24) TaxID=649638 RepID=D7CXD2_TRURR|nr:antibiotic biosynthesis monooxygenase [Truepera radiovictrix]ADI13256.1 Antibiotic biosynthesis monooxygenase [Truepera radiovictrix DSM 17093]WMT58180.1 antibiotic biosynthesis monooxygenase [Truepera radiovictrix]